MVHKDGMSIDMSTGAMKCTFYLYLFFSIACIVGMAYGGIGNLLPLIPICLIIYWIMSCCSQASQYIWNAMDVDGAYDNLNDVIEARPEVKWHIQCYHYEDRKVTVRDKDGNTRTETKRVRVNTHAASGHFEFTEWKDLSDSIDILFFIEKLRAVRLHVYDNIRYSPKAERMHRE